MPSAFPPAQNDARWQARRPGLAAGASLDRRTTLAHQPWSEDDGASATVKPFGPGGQTALVDQRSQYQPATTAAPSRVVANIELEELAVVGPEGAVYATGPEGIVRRYSLPPATQP